MITTFVTIAGLDIEVEGDSCNLVWAKGTGVVVEIVLDAAELDDLIEGLTKARAAMKEPA